MLKLASKHVTYFNGRSLLNFIIYIFFIIVFLLREVI